MLVIGGGINGTGIARDAAGRGLNVTLVEQGDLAGATSSASTKLVHGGLRYLEHYEFGLVRESLQERERLWAIAPHLIYPLRFVLPHHRDLRPAVLIRLGLFLYDHIGGRKRLPATRTLALRTDPSGAPLKPLFQKGFEYSDCWVDDARLVVANAQSAQSHGATILTHTCFTGAERRGGLWHATIEDRDGNEHRLVARTIVNAAGAWVKSALESCAGVTPTPSSTLLVKGSHIILRRLYEGDHAYTFQSGDGRVIFAIPYEGDYTLVGTTDQAFDGDPGDIHISDEEIRYLCDQASRYLRTPVTPDRVVWTYSGVRPLYDDGSSKTAETTRDYVLELDDADGKAPVLSIFGGKITTYRRLAEDALEKLAPYHSYRRGAWTADEPLPGGAITNAAPGSFDPSSAFESFIKQLTDTYPDLDPALLRRYGTAYGTQVHTLLAGIESKKQLGRYFGGGLYECEVRYWRDHEWAESADDMLWRRSKLGLSLSGDERDALADWLSQ